MAQRVRRRWAVMGGFDQSRIFYRGSTADETALRPNSGSEYCVLGISTSPDEEYAKMHGEYVRRYYAKKGELMPTGSELFFHDTISVLKPVGACKASIRFISSCLAAASDALAPLPSLL